MNFRMVLAFILCIIAGVVIGVGYFKFKWMHSKIDGVLYRDGDDIWLSPEVDPKEYMENSVVFFVVQDLSRKQ